MITAQKPLFLIPETPLLFSEVGCIWGSFHEDNKQEDSPYIKGMLKTKDNREFRADVRRKNWKRWVETGAIKPSSRNYWRVYFRTTRAGIINNVELVRVIKQTFPVEIEPFGESLEDYEDLFRIRGKIAEITEKGFSIKIERNNFPNERRVNLKYFYLTLQGALNSEEQLDQFWDVICIRDGDYLKPYKGTLITEELIKNWDKKLEQQEISYPSKLVKNKKPSQSKPSQQQASKEITTIMINGKQPEITVKFTERPEVPEQGKKVELQITGENGIVIKGELNRKTLAKQVQKIDNFEDWIGAFSGIISEITSEGVVILERGSVQIFERKKKVKPEDKELQKNDDGA